MTPLVPPSDTLLNRYAPPKPINDYPHLTFYQSDDLIVLWEAWEKETQSECPVPFWAHIWPASLVLLSWIVAKNYCVSRKVIDIGCGAGAVAIAAAQSGAISVTANDTDPIALYITGKNSDANNTVLSLSNQNMADNVDSILQHADLVFMCDMFYEKSLSSLFTHTLKRCVSRGCEVIIADANRPFVPKHEAELLYEKDVDVDQSIENTDSRLVRIYRLRA